MDLAAELGAIIGLDKVKSGEGVTSLDPGIDGRNLGAGIMAFPQSTEEVSRVLAFCHARRISVVPQGGRTGLAGGAVSRAGASHPVAAAHEQDYPH